jgi:hypothetical protein
VITAQWVRSRLRIAATLTTVTKSETGRDDMNRPAEVTVDTAVRCYLDAQTSAETSDGQVVGTAKFVGYVPACVDVTGADRLTVLGAPYEIVGPPEPFIHPYTCERVAWKLNLVRTA